MFAWQFTKMLARADAHGWTRFVVDAEPLQPGLPRGRARDAAALPRGRASASFRGARWRAAFSPATGAARTSGETARAKTDDFAHELYYADTDFTIAERVVELAAQRGVKPTQIALAWLLAKPGVTAPIIGASKLAHLDDAVAALDIRLDADEMAFLEAPYQPHAILGHS